MDKPNDQFYTYIESQHGHIYVLSYLVGQYAEAIAELAKVASATGMPECDYITAREQITFNCGELA